jgi:hypothetical protein
LGRDLNLDKGREIVLIKLEESLKVVTVLKENVKEIRDSL